MLYRELKPRRIVAFDLAEDMIKYASNRPKNSRNPTAIHYYQANACEQFDTLAAKLDLTVSSVDVITSFYCIHWVPDKRQTCLNIYGFLKPSGKFYLINSVWNELFPVQHRIIEHEFWRPYLMQWVREMKDGLSKKEVAEASQDADEGKLTSFEILHKPNHEALHKFWNEHCLESALVMEEMSVIYTDYPFKLVQDFNGNKWVG
jgi:SAM-dependent methyltransferase